MPGRLLINYVGRRRAKYINADISSVDNFIGIAKPFFKAVYAKKQKTLINTFYYLH